MNTTGLYSFLTSAVVVCFLLAKPAQAGRPLLRCAEIFLSIKNTLGLTGFTSQMLDTRKIREQTVFRRALVRDQFNDGFYIFERDGKAWGSNASTNTYNPQGDPRWLLEVFGTHLAPVWGFFWDGSSRLQGPTPATWNRRLALLSQVLVARGENPITVRYDELAHQREAAFAHLDERSLYVEDFLFDGVLPLHPDGLQYLHDVSFHTGAILLDRPITDAARARLEYFYQAYIYIDGVSRSLRSQPNAYASIVAEGKFLRLVARALRMYVVESIDNGTGIINPVIAGAHVDDAASLPVTFDESFADDIYQHLLGSPNLSPYSDLRDLLRELALKKNIVKFQVPDYSVTYFDALLREFEPTFKSSFSNFDRYALPPISLSQFCQMMLRRRALLLEAAATLRPQLPRAPLELIDERGGELRDTRPWWRRQISKPDLKFN